jgi:hypothetical protein
MRRRAATTVLLTAALVACADELPQEGLIVTTRVLAIRADVTVSIVDEGDEFETTRAQALPFETVHITPFIVSPDGPVDPADTDPVWLACELGPGQGLFGCISAAFPTDLDELEACPIPSFEDLQGEEPPPFPSPCIIARTGAPDFVVPVAPAVFTGGSFELTMIASTPGGTSTDACAEPFLGGDHELPNDCIYAVQRLTLGPVERLALLAQELGFEFPGVEAPDPEDVPEGDRNPRISAFDVSVLDDAGEPGEPTAVADGATLMATLLEILRLDVVSPEEDLQTYPISVNNGESFEERVENYGGRWYRTWGRTLSDFSDDPESYNEWTLSPGSQDETEAPPEGRAWLYYVVRDSRAGVAWHSFAIEVDEP